MSKRFYNTLFLVSAIATPVVVYAGSFVQRLQNEAVGYEPYADMPAYKPITLEKWKPTLGYGGHGAGGIAPGDTAGPCSDGVTNSSLCSVSSDAASQGATPGSVDYTNPVDNPNIDAKNPDDTDGQGNAPTQPATKEPESVNPAPPTPAETPSDDTPTPFLPERPHDETPVDPEKPTIQFEKPQETQVSVVRDDDLYNTCMFQKGFVPDYVCDRVEDPNTGSLAGFDPHQRTYILYNFYSGLWGQYASKTTDFMRDCFYAYFSRPLFFGGAKNAARTPIPDSQMKQMKMPIKPGETCESWIKRGTERFCEICSYKYAQN